MLSLRGYGSLENRTGPRRRSPAASHNEIIAENRCATLNQTNEKTNFTVDIYNDFIHLIFSREPN